MHFPKLAAHTQAFPLRRWAIFGGLALALYSLRFWYREADIAALHWLLLPTATLLEWITGQHWWADAQGRLLFPGLQVLLHKGCAGFGFLRLALLMAAYTHLFTSWPQRLHWLAWWPLLLGTPWALTILANTARIYSLLFVQQRGWQQLHPALHGLVGLAVYGAVLASCMALVKLYSLRQHFIKNTAL